MNTIIKTTLSIFFMILSTYSFAQELSVIESNEKYGFENAQGKIVIQAVYDRAEDFSDNLALVMKNNKFGFIDKKGIVKIPLKYDNAESFYEGLAKVNQGAEFSELIGRLGGTWGLINKEGKVIIPIEYRGIDFIANGEILATKDNKGYIFNRKGKLIRINDFAKFAESDEFMD